MPNPAADPRPAQPDPPRLSLYRTELSRAAGRPSAVPPADPAALLRLAPPGAPRFYWSAPDDDLVIAAFGAAHSVAAEGPGRLADVARACAAVQAELEVIESEPADLSSARWLGGFAFEDLVCAEGLWSGFPSAVFTLPEVMLLVQAGRAWLVLVGPRDRRDLPDRAREIGRRLAAVPALPDLPSAEPGNRSEVIVAGRPLPSMARSAEGLPKRPDPPPDLTDAAASDLRERIERVIDAIRRGEAEKVVLATARTLALPEGFDPLAALGRLRGLQPGCFHFLLSPGPGLAFLGASPERLVRVQGDRLSTMALAGSARRDRDPAVDRALGQSLLASPKDRAEHALVVAAVVEALDGYALDVPAEPRLRRLAAIQHLETPIDARLLGQGDVLAQAARLHPTPALGGTPRPAALRLIRELEGFERGWYGGGVGWIDGGGNGDLAVAIRSLLVTPRAVTAFAGAGLIAASDPEAELREIGLKLATVLTLVDAGVLSPVQTALD